MEDYLLIDAKPSGFVMIKYDGCVFLLATADLKSPRVGGEEWDVDNILMLKPGQYYLGTGSKWIVRSEDEETIVFEMIDPESKIKWGVPLRMSVLRAEIEKGMIDLALYL